MTTSTESPIINALKTEYSLRVHIGHRWLVWGDNERWQVWKRPPHARKSLMVMETDDEGAAVAALVGEGEAE